jgi:hypothetical protein
VARRLPAKLQLQPTVAHARAKSRGRFIPLEDMPRASWKTRVTPGTALALLGFGVGALVFASRSRAQAAASPNEQTAKLQKAAVEAQQLSAAAARRARTLTTQWQDAARATEGH